ncbi:hypothetical protein R4282_07195 [Rhodococcus oxybenzonivorans]|uniref:hypothetical protein n=1 Tax=Rhodococcus oxybenzonivorans TaxID=1990687 RepID=UPI00295514F9|nr:hypothetical protein [Rhodococcus oxybenzonivorans]MDV7352798.1 hypothetical protein [Rhodococcus oxybenzonivorans]
MAAEPETGITGEVLTKVAETEISDSGVAEKFLATEEPVADDGVWARGRGGTREWYGGFAYGTDGLRGATDDAGHEAVIKPKPLPAHVEGGFTVEDFTVDEQTRTVSCPAGHMWSS